MSDDLFNQPIALQWPNLLKQHDVSALAGISAKQHMIFGAIRYH